MILFKVLDKPKSILENVCVFFFYMVVEKKEFLPKSEINENAQNQESNSVSQGIS